MNRRVMGARASTNPTLHSGRPNPGSTLLIPDPTARPSAPGVVKRTRATKMTGAQRNSIGRLSEWSRGPYAPKGGWR